MHQNRTLKSDVVLLLVLLLCGMNFQANFFYFAFGFFVLQCLVRHKLSFDRMFVVYFLFFIVYALYGLSEGITEVVRRIIILCVYVAGYNSVISHISLEKVGFNNCIEAWLNKCLIVFSAGAFLHYFFNMIFNFASATGRNTLDVWSGEVLSATGQAALACPMLGVAVAYIIASDSKRKRLLSIIAIAIIMIYNTVLAGRTLVVLLFVDIFFCIALYFIYEKSQKRRLKLLGILFLIFLIVSTLYAFDAFGIKTIFEQSNLYTRFFGDHPTINLLEDGRAYRKMYYLKHMWAYVFGGNHMNSQVGFAHDLFLDCFNEMGILATVPLLIIVASSVLNLIKVVKTAFLSVQSKVLLLSFYFCIYVMFFLEPILQGPRWLFVGFCLMNGCVSAIKEVCIKRK